MVTATPERDTHPLVTLVELGHRARQARSAEELAFVLVNDTHSLTPYRQAAFWLAEGGIQAESGIYQPEGHAPYTLWLTQVCQTLAHQDHTARAMQALDPKGPQHLGPRLVSAQGLRPQLAEEWADWLPAYAVWLPLEASPRHPGSVAGGALLASETPFNQEILPFLAEWRDIWQHAWLSRFQAKPWSFALWKERCLNWYHAHQDGPWWRRRPIQIALTTFAVLAFPVRLTVLAPGELVPAQPSWVRSPFEGVIEQIQVQPNQMVKPGQVLFTFDQAAIASRLEVARQALATAEAEYRQQASLALTESKYKGQLVVLQGKVGEKRAEAEYLEAQYARSQVVAEQEGMVLFDDPTEWVGKPVQTGERIMRIASPQDREIEAWIPIADAIPLTERADVQLYLAASPFSSLSGQMRYLGHDAVPRPDGVYAYRLRATLTDITDQRIGLKGTAKIVGGWVPLSYWVLRRPLASLRQFLAF